MSETKPFKAGKPAKPRPDDDDADESPPAPTSSAFVTGAALSLASATLLCSRCRDSLVVSSSPIEDDPVAAMASNVAAAFPGASVHVVLPKRHVKCPSRWTEHRVNSGGGSLMQGMQCDACQVAFRYDEPYLVEYDPRGDTHRFYHDGCGPSEVVEGYGLTTVQKELRTAASGMLAEELKRRELAASRREDREADRQADAVGKIARQLIEAFGLVHNDGEGCDDVYACVRCYIEDCERVGMTRPVDGLRLRLSLERYRGD